MKTIKTFALLAFLICGTAFSAKAQSDYSTAVGLRAAWGIALTGKKFINDNAAIEGILHYRRWGYFSYNYNRVTIMGLYQHHNRLDDVIPGLAWYFGGGAFVGFYGGDFDFVDGSDDGSTYLGIAGNLGVDYKFEEFPINVSVDWIPAFAFSGFGNGFGGESGGVAIRYTF